MGQKLQRVPSIIISYENTYLLGNDLFSVVYAAKASANPAVSKHTCELILGINPISVFYATKALVDISLCI